MVTVGEVARLAQEADLTELDGLRIQLEQAEKRQARHQWRRQHERTENAAAARRKHLRGGHSSVSGGVDGGGVGGGVGGAAESGAQDRGDARYNGNGLGLPKDALERAQDLAMSLRVEVETLRLANALEAGTQGVGVEAENGGVGKEGATAATVASGVRESCHAQEEVSPPHSMEVSRIEETFGTNAGFSNAKDGLGGLRIIKPFMCNLSGG